MPPPVTEALPIRARLPSIVEVLARDRVAVLVSPPGTGKTTLVPPALAQTFSGRILLAQPRRVAARAAAARMASQCGENVGDTVGFSVRGESRVSGRTRIEVVTTGLLLRRLQHDPELAGVDVVVIDECHERHLDTDLVLAFLVDVRANLRPDLVVLAMSATTHADRIAEVLGGDADPAPIIDVAGVAHPVQILWCPPPAGLRPAQGTRVDPALLEHVTSTVRRALQESAGDILVFLPGGYEIAVLQRNLRDLPVRVQVLHGSLDGRDQDAVLRRSTERRVVLATAIAESSLTVPGVAVVVDAGLSRQPRADLARGLSALVTVRASRASATQRAGRAGREGPGRAYRCWPESEQHRLPEYPDPEIAGADLTDFLLELACWGNPRGEGLHLPDAPGAAAVSVAEQTLRQLGAVDDRGRVTTRGERLTGVGVHPRLARALLDAVPLVGIRRATEVVAVISAGLDGGSQDDLATGWRQLRSGQDPSRTARWRAEIERLRGRAARGTGGDPAPPGSTHSAEHGDEAAAGIVVGLAYPERLARRRSADPAVAADYLMAGGTAAELATTSAFAGTEWLAVCGADRPPGRRTARIRSAVAVDVDLARLVGSSLTVTEPRVEWVGGNVRSTTVERLGVITLVERPLSHPDAAALARAVRTGLAAEGLALLRWSPAAVALRARLAACRSGLAAATPEDAPWPDVSDAALLAGIDLDGLRNRADLQRIDLVHSLRRLLPWQRAAELDQVAPERITVPSGSSVRIDYTDPEAPVLAVKLQELFGWQRAPVVAGRPLRMVLLTPAGRTAAITADLATFWVSGYPLVRAELRGRYPRHPWPEDPTTAVPTARVTPRKS